MLKISKVFMLISQSLNFIVLIKYIFETTVYEGKLGLCLEI